MNEVLSQIAAWTPARHTMPRLASHPMRVVGWLTFTLASRSLDEAHDDFRHARIHSDITHAALDC